MTPPRDSLRIYAPAGPIDHPPLPPLRALLDRLAAAGLSPALGGSGLVAALGRAGLVNDWDITVDAPIESLEAACAGLGFGRVGHGGCHADHKLEFELQRVELIARFSFFVPGGVVGIPTAITGTWQGLPVGSPTAWAAAYALMGELEDSPRRRERADALFDWLGEGPPEREVCHALLDQPLPETIAGRIRALRGQAPCE